MSKLAKFGVTPEHIAGGHGEVRYPKPVQGRVAHLDADFMAYQVSAESKAELDPDDPTPRKSLEDMQHNAKEAAIHLMRTAAATEYVCHVTPTGSDKGGRDKQAIQKEYQANRKARKEKPLHLDAIREYIGTQLNGVMHMRREADDGMAQAAYSADDPNLCIIVSADKDLRMVPGYQCLPATGKIMNVRDRFGSIAIDDTKSSKKLVGFGTKFFWAQLLMGDPADNIQGLPQLAGTHAMEVKPTQAYMKLEKQWMDAEGDKADAIAKRMRAMEKPKKVGAMMAYDLLKDIQTDRDAFEQIRLFWKENERCGYEYRHWNTTERVTATQAMLSDMQLLWMRRADDPNDVVNWLKDRMKDGKYNGRR